MLFSEWFPLGKSEEVDAEHCGFFPVFNYKKLSPRDPLRVQRGTGKCLYAYPMGKHMCTNLFVDARAVLSLASV